MMTRMARMRYPLPLTLCHLFDVLVVPAITYGVKFGVERNRAEFCKYVLNIPTSANNITLYGEEDYIPLLIKRKVRMLKYWLKVIRC